MTELSFSAQAVIDAYCTEADRLDREVSHEEMLAAALRAAALICTRERRTLMAIADELEGIKYGTYRCDLEDKPQ
jgi:hypothetical protein